MLTFAPTPHRRPRLKSQPQCCQRLTSAPPMGARLAFRNALLLSCTFPHCSWPWDPWRRRRCLLAIRAALHRRRPAQLLADAPRPTRPQRAPPLHSALTSPLDRRAGASLAAPSAPLLPHHPGPAPPRHFGPPPPASPPTLWPRRCPSRRSCTPGHPGPRHLQRSQQCDTGAPICATCLSPSAFLASAAIAPPIGPRAAALSTPVVWHACARAYHTPCALCRQPWAAAFDADVSAACNNLGFNPFADSEPEATPCPLATSGDRHCVAGPGATSRPGHVRHQLLGIRSFASRRHRQPHARRKSGLASASRFRVMVGADPCSPVYCCAGPS